MDRKVHLNAHPIDSNAIWLDLAMHPTESNTISHNYLEVHSICTCHLLAPDPVSETQYMDLRPNWMRAQSIISRWKWQLYEEGNPGENSH